MTAPPALRPSPDVICRDLEGEAVLLDLASGRYFGLNAVGSRVWSLLDAGTTVEGIVAAIVEEFDAGPEDVARDVGELLTELASRGLVITTPPPAR